MTNLGTAVLKIDTDESGIDKGFASVKQKATGLGHTMSTALGSAAGFAAAQVGMKAMDGAFGLLIGNAANFEQSMGAVAASTGATKDEMAAFRKEALSIGADTSKSASEAVLAMGELAKAGVSMETILAGAGRSAVQLAEATGIAVPAAATIMSTAMNVFSADGLKASEVADILAKTAVASAIGVEDLALSLAAGGTVAASAGLSMAEFTTVMGLMGNAGMRGSDAGTSLKAMLAGLTPVTDKAKDSMEALGFSAFDVEGNFKSMPEIVKELSDAMEGLTEEQKAATLEMWFGSDGLRAAQILLKGGTEGWEAFTAAVAKSPTVAEQSKKRLEGLNGAIEMLKGSVETVSIIFGTLFLGALEAGVQVLVAMANAIVPLVAAFLGLTPVQAALQGIAAAFAFLKGHEETFIILGSVMAVVFGPMVAAAIIAVTAAVLGFAASMAAAAIGVLLAAAPLILIGVAIGAVVIGVLALIEHFGLLNIATTFLKEQWTAFQHMFNLGLEGGQIGGKFTAIQQAGFALGTFVRDTLIPAWNDLKEAFRLFVLGLEGGDIGGKFTAMQQAAFDLGEGIRKFWYDDAKPALEDLKAWWVEAWPEIKSVLAFAWAEIEDTFNDIVKGIKWLNDEVDDTVADITKVWKFLSSEFEDTKNDINRAVDFVADKFYKLRDWVSGAINDLYNWIKPVIDKIIDLVNKVVAAAEKVKSIASAVAGGSAKDIAVAELKKQGYTDEQIAEATAGMASGGRVSRGTSYVVGERGWEIFQPDTAGTIFDHEDSEDMLSGRGNAEIGGALGQMLNLIIELDGEVLHRSEQRLQGRDLRLAARGVR